MVETANKPVSAEDIHGWMFPEELAWLSEQAAKSASVAEIGCWKGRSTFALLSACAGPVYAIDHFQGSPDEPGHAEARKDAVAVRREFLRNCGDFPNLRMIERDSLAAAEMFRGQELDMVFIDASHRYEDVLADIRAWLPKTRRLFAGHDYSRDWPGVVRAVHQIFGTAIQRAAQSIWYFEVNA
jgi:SAM-dependent methyltransferase